MRYVYGPVPSRRLGRSLGVDLIPFKTCSYDCIYCQLGRTTNKTTERKEYAPLADVLAELSCRLPLAPAPDFIGIAGSGEPTLHRGIGTLIAAIKKLTTIPVAVLTNGSLLSVADVRAGLAEADLVLPSLDAWDQRSFERVNRPHRAISFERMTEGLIAFAEGFRGLIWLEVFVLGGISDTAERLEAIGAIAKRIRPARVQLNTVSRPPAEDRALAVPIEKLERLRGTFCGTCEVIADSGLEPGASPAAVDAEDEILALLARRPCTVQGVAEGLGLRPNEVIKHVDVLLKRGLLRSEKRAGSVFYERTRTR